MNVLFKKIHLWLSLPFGLIFSIICFTGAILVFEKEITQMVTTGTEKNQPVELPQSSHVEKQIRQESPHAGMGEHKMKKARAPRLPFFQTVFKMHRWLLDAPAKKGENSAGKMVVGISTLMMVLVLASGIVIWFPKSFRQLRIRLKVSVRKSWYRFLYDSHVSLGIYASIFLLVMALTGLTWSFSWYKEGFVAIFDGFVESSEMRRFIYTLHTGSWGGVITKTLYFLSSLLGAVFPWTGYYLWYKKFK